MKCYFLVEAEVTDQSWVAGCLKMSRQWLSAAAAAIWPARLAFKD